MTKLYNTPHQTKLKVDGLDGLLVFHKSGHIAASVDHIAFLAGDAVECSTPGYRIVKTPTAKEIAETMRRAAAGEEK
jgi:hypothetical protein